LHFYDFNIGDYAKKTQHLTNEEDLAYRRALDMYYDTEKPLPINESGGLASLSRRLRVSIEALQNVVNEFFPNGINKHADEKIAAYYAYIEKQKANGKQGGRPKHKPTANPPHSQNNPVPSQTLTTKPLTTKPETSIKPSMRKNAHEDLFNHFWNEYPKKVGKLAALKAWQKASPEIELVLNALHWQKASSAWMKDDGQYIPNPATYINQSRWLDEPQRHLNSSLGASGQATAAAAERFLASFGDQANE